ncbi:MAG: type II toxin-antitoxin system PemK/MazF family toxin [Bacteroidota bacterium]
MPNIKQGDVWKVSNIRQTQRREVVVVGNDEYSKETRLYQVIPLDDVNSGRRHPFNLRVRGRNVAVDLISTLPEEFFLDKKAAALPEEMERIRTALFELFSGN